MELLSVWSIFETKSFVICSACMRVISSYIGPRLYILGNQIWISIAKSKLQMLKMLNDREVGEGVTFYLRRQA